MFITKVSVFFAAAALVTAWPSLDGKVSPGCQSALETLLSNDTLTGCFGVNGLVDIISTPKGQDYIPALNERFSTICTSRACTPDDIAYSGKIFSACTQDTVNLGYPEHLAESVTKVLANYYGTFLEVVCLQNQTSGNYCLTDTWYEIEGAAGDTLSLHDLLAQTIIGGVSVSGDISSLNPDIACNECNAAAYTIINNAKIAGFSSSPDVQAVVDQCPSGWGESVPSNVILTGPNASGSIPDQNDSGSGGGGTTPTSTSPPSALTSSAPFTVPESPAAPPTVTPPIVPTDTAATETATGTASTPTETLSPTTTGVATVSAPTTTESVPAATTTTANTTSTPLATGISTQNLKARAMRVGRL